MARSDLLISLVKASVGGDKNAVRMAVESIIADEKDKQHNVLAERLTDAIQVTETGRKAIHKPFHEAKNPRKEALIEIMPKQRLDDIVLSEQTRNTIDQLIEEQHRRDLLHTHGLNRRHRIMLIGPPGNGKTSTAEAIAEALAVLFYVIRYEDLIGSYLGETAMRLKRVFCFVCTTPCVVFFDEFDAVGKERGDMHETGEIKRVVSSLLMQVDELPSYTIIIIASNHSELLDRAVWQRFQLRLFLPAPTIDQLAAYFGRHFQQFNAQPRMTPTKLARKLGDTSYAEAEEFMLSVRRRQVLEGSEESLNAIFDEQLNAWENRANSEN